MRYITTTSKCICKNDVMGQWVMGTLIQNHEIWNDMWRFCFENDLNILSADDNNFRDFCSYYFDMG